MICCLPLEVYSIIFDSLTINDIMNIYYVNKFLLGVLSDEMFWKNYHNNMILIVCHFNNI